MGKVVMFAAIGIALWLSTFAIAQDILPPKACNCFTATSWAVDNGCPAFEPKEPCKVPLCLHLSTTTIPGPNPRCSKTPTLTSYFPCQTACPVGCPTATITETASRSCLPTPKPTLSLTTLSKPTQKFTTSFLHTRPCYTKTVTASNRCPEDELGCPPPDCIWLSTTLVPPGPVPGCPTTPTLTKTRTCVGRCDGSCGTQWVTETATAWR